MEGKFPVLGTVQDLHLREFRLEAAPGKDAGSGFTLISSGTAGVVSGVLGAWDTKGLSGFFTLRLTAVDQVDNAAILQTVVFIGDPEQSLVLGNHDVFNLPQAVAVGGDGRIYVADRNNDRIAVFSSTGTFLASVTPLLNKPGGVAVDAADSLYIADTNNDRVVKLSTSGQVLLELAGFNKPAAVATDSSGRIFVSDTENRRVQAFSAEGEFAFEIPLPAAEPDEKGKPYGIALDAAGNIYVADGNGRRALKFSPAGELVFTFTAEFKEPEGIAVSPDGGCVLVSDRKLARIVKFDGQGNLNLAFGGKDKDEDAILLRKPMGMAMDGLGNLFVADRNTDSIRKFGLPTGQPTLVVPPAQPGSYLLAQDVIDSEDGGEVSRKDNAGVEIPANALPEDLKITVSSASQSDLERQRSREEKNLKAASPAVEFGPEGTTFTTPVTLVLPYDAALAQADAEAGLKVNYWNKEKGEWEELPSVVDKESKTVKAQTTHFSLYQVFSPAATVVAAASADPSFVLRDVYVYPNPAVGGAKPVIHVAVGVADKVSIKIFNIAGQQVHEASLDNQPAVIDDGKGPNYAYEYIWDGHIPSGVYLYTIDAEKGGQHIRKAGKFAVIR
ncbi:MAG: T9SS type A sorting domain-containing protein [Planctomycetota bacterium]